MEDLTKVTLEREQTLDGKITKKIRHIKVKTTSKEDMIKEALMLGRCSYVKLFGDSGWSGSYVITATHLNDIPL